ncbi:rab-interacting lysosomal protein [Eublepharis macularius]|uniref:Rab-interacting lysosomal protein n=1 Tax=Eublepharis macularius TaxID=481883 RepID=A0AA97LJG8_EUBMA|nr:rab-interacting lysosomal protein [Eublepharis macularius]
MEEPAAKPGAPRQLALEQVYRLAGSLGSELQRLSDLCGSAAVAALVPQVVCLLELLEALAAGAGPRKLPQREAATATAGEEVRPAASQDEEETLSEGRKRERLLQVRLAQVEEENQKLLGQLAGGQSQADRATHKEREVMLRLKEVVDKQRDEIRAQAHEILSKSRDTEALQEQLSRFMAVNEELRHKLAVVQLQLKKALQEKEALENALLATSREADRLKEAQRGKESSRPGMDKGAAAAPMEEAPSRDQGGRCFSKEELQEILQERNELKTSLFLVREELAYYQRELLNNERIPSLLLGAMQLAIRKQHKKIRAKMLGTTEESGSSDEEEGVWLASPDSDTVDGSVAQSRIKSFFGLWYRSGKDSSTDAYPGAWEIVDRQEVDPEKEEEERKGA